MGDVLRPCGFCRPTAAAFVVAGFVLTTLCSPLTVRADELATLRDEVRANDEQSAKQKPNQKEEGIFDELTDSVMSSIGGLIVSTPFWFPRAITNDNGDEGYFSCHPYHDGRRYMMFDQWTDASYRWAARLRCDYAEDFDDMSRVGGHLLLSTTSRWGLDTEMNYLQERLPGDRHDQLWLGDCNVVYRFAQSERSQWRAGIGLNWLDDPIETNYGVNFTYGFDLFPVRPLILSTELDWGTLGSADAFHFRTTLGATLYGVETYIGYEYRDIDSFYFNGLVAGVRLWF